MKDKKYEKKLEYEKKLGKIKSVDLFIEDHGILTFFIYFDFGGSAQGFGGWAVDEWDKEKDRRVGTAFGADLIRQLLDFFCVDRLKDIEGTICYALYEKPHRWNDLIKGIETLPFDSRAPNKRFLIDYLFEEWFANEQWYKDEKKRKEATRSA